MNDNLENHMVLNGPDAPWNAREPGQWECDCGYDHSREVKRLTYPLWRNNGRHFVEDCAHEHCTQRCCHQCAVTCLICGCHYCPEHQGGFFAALSLCADCSEGYVTFAASQDKADLQALLKIEARRASARPYGRGFYLLDSEVDWLIAQLKEAWEANTSSVKSQAGALNRCGPTGADMRPERDEVLVFQQRPVGALQGIDGLAQG